MEKTYSILIQFGNGTPVTSQIRARNGIDAQDKAMAVNPGARSIRITGVIEVHQPPPVKTVRRVSPPSHPLFTDVNTHQVNFYLRNSTQEEKLELCHELRKEGLSYRAIAKQLNMGETTVRTWIKNTLPSS